MNIALKVKVKLILGRWVLRGSQNTEKWRESVFPLIFNPNLFLKRKKLELYLHLAKNVSQLCSPIYKICIIKIILTLTHHTQIQVRTVNKIIMSTSLLSFSWPDKFTAEFSEEPQTLVHVKSSELLIKPCQEVM